MSETDLLKQILTELQKINLEVQNLKASVDGNFELLENKLSVLESILDKIRDNTIQ